MGSRSGVRSDLELNGYLQGTSADSGIDTTSFTATQSSTASSSDAFRGDAKDKIPWQEDHTGAQRASATPPPAPEPLVAIGGGEIPAKSPSAFPPVPDGGSYSLSDASHSRFADALFQPAVGS